MGGARVRREARLWDFDKRVAFSYRICCPFPILGCMCRLSIASHSTGVWESRQTGRQGLTNFLYCNEMKTRAGHKKVGLRAGYF